MGGGRREKHLRRSTGVDIPPGTFVGSRVGPEDRRPDQFRNNVRRRVDHGRNQQEPGALTQAVGLRFKSKSGRHCVDQFMF